MIHLGAYVKGSSPRLDFAIAKNEALQTFLRQPVEEQATRQSSVEKIASILR